MPCPHFADCSHPGRALSSGGKIGTYGTHRTEYPGDGKGREGGGDVKSGDQPVSRGSSGCVVEQGQPGPVTETMQVGLRLRLGAGRLKQVEFSAVSTGIMSLFARLEDLESTVDRGTKILDSSSPYYV